jgi:hypothetical protein
MGSADPRAYSRNKRGIAGQLVWINFDRNSLLNLFHKAAGSYVADVDEIRPQYQMNSIDANALFASSIVRANGTPISATLNQLDTQVTDIYSQVTLASPSYSDQVLPFDVTLAGANEYGAMCAAKILGVEIHTRSLRPWPPQRLARAQETKKEESGNMKDERCK